MKKISDNCSTANGRKNLVIVESPAKARTIGRIMGDGYEVVACLGHTRDLPEKRLGVMIEKNFEPTYVVPAEKRALIATLKNLGADASDIYLATDPDREGEAIAWHLQEAAGWSERLVLPRRVVFHEITEEAIREAFSNPGSIDMDLVNAQRARRVLDRLYGFLPSKLLRSKVQRGLSAGRVQSPALRLIVDREKEISEFFPVESWTLDVVFSKTDQRQEFRAKLRGEKGVKGNIEIGGEKEARQYQSILQDATYTVSSVRKQKRLGKPAPPFTTSTMQQDALGKLGYFARDAMSLAQSLYEGIDLGGGDLVGLITYMRTDSTQLASSAISEMRSYIASSFGEKYLPDQHRTYPVQTQNAQEAHEAIRPTSIFRDPVSLKSRLKTREWNLYNLIWSRTIASQMVDARYERTTIEIEGLCGGTGYEYRFNNVSTSMLFPGFRAVYIGPQENDDDAGSEPALSLVRGDTLQVKGLEALQHFTSPPSRYTDASLIKDLEGHGIGRPGTYVPTIDTILNRKFVERSGKSFFATHPGNVVAEFLGEHLPILVDYKFTARMEEGLDLVAQGKRDWRRLLGEYFSQLENQLEIAQDEVPRVSLDEEIDRVCEVCSKSLVIRYGRRGPFIACTGFPECRKTEMLPEMRTSVPCNNERCDGEMVERKRNKGGRRFWGCSNFPGCNAISNVKPVGICEHCRNFISESREGGVACVACGEQVTVDEWTRKVEVPVTRHQL